MRPQTRAIGIVLAVVMLLSLCTPLQARAAAPKLERVDVTLHDQTENVLETVMDLEQDIIGDVQFAVAAADADAVAAYRLTQAKRSEPLYQGSEAVFDVPVGSMAVGQPLTCTLLDREGRELDRRVLNLRIVEGKTSKMFSSQISSEFGSGIKIDMSQILPGMEFDMLPFVIPVTVKTFADGRFRVGLGVNSSDVDFWKEAAEGKLPEKINNDKLVKILTEDTDKQSAVKGKNMGLIIIFAGWAEGNIHTREPAKGHFQIFIGTGFDIRGQYTILTWEVTLTGGGTGEFDFSFVFDESDSQYHYQTDNLSLGAKGGLELFGGIGCVSVAALGIYGAGSVAVSGQLYPSAGIDHLIFAGECGFKVKIFGKNLFTFKFLSGSKDVLEDSVQNGRPLLDLGAGLAEARKYLIAQHYADMVPKEYDQIDREPTWNGTDVTTPTQPNSGVYRESSAHLLSSGIYPDAWLQLSPVGFASYGLGSMLMTFVGNDLSRSDGNRECIQSSRYNLANGIVVEPKRVTDSEFAEYQPDFYADPKSDTGYLVFQRAREPITPDMSYGEIAERTDVWYTRYNANTDTWSDQQHQLTFLSDAVAMKPQIFCRDDGSICVAYYTNTLDDPAGLACRHQVYLLRSGGESGWERILLGETEGEVTSFGADVFCGENAVCITTESEEQTRTTVYHGLGSGEVWTRSGAEDAQFVDYYGEKTVVWTEDHALYRLTDSYAAERISQENLPLPEAHWSAYGDFGEKGMMVFFGSEDASQNALALVRSEPDNDWWQLNVTDIQENALINYFSAAYTPGKLEPVIVYSVQNYKNNFDPGRLDASSYLNGEYKAPLKLNSPEICIGEADERFSDTVAELFIQPLEANRRVTIQSAYPDDESAAVPGGDLPASVTIRNNGLYPVDQVWLALNDQSLGAFPVDLKPGASKTLSIALPIPAHPQGSELTFTLTATARETVPVQSKREIRVGEGFLTLQVLHTRTDHERIACTVVNNGFSDKEYRLFAQDKKTGRLLLDKTGVVSGGQSVTETLSAENELFFNAGIWDVSVFVFTGDETEEDTVSVNRKKHVVPLDLKYMSTYSAAPAHGFKDVPADAWYAEAVHWAAGCGVTKGTSETTFSPNDPCTRAQAVTFLWRAMGCPQPATEKSPFKDVSKDAYYYHAVLWAAEKGITNGTSDTSFSPNEPCTRAHVVTFLFRSAGSPGVTGAEIPFRDVPGETYYTDAVLWAVSEKITNGTDAAHFSPSSLCTRGQIVTFLYRYMK